MMFVNYNLVFVFDKTKRLRCMWFPAEPSVANDRNAERRAGGKGVAVCAVAQRILAAEHRSAMGGQTTDGVVGTRCLDSRWWVPERSHDCSLSTKFGKSSKTHLFFKVR